MSSSGRVLDGKYRQAIETYLAKNYSPEAGCDFDDDFAELCDVIAVVFKDVMTLMDVRQVMLEGFSACGVSPFRSRIGFAFPPGPEAMVVAQSIVDAFARYPRDYTCELTLPMFFSSGLDGASVQLANGVLLRLPGPNEKSASIFVKGNGYFYRNSESPYSSEIVKLAKIFLFILRKFSGPLYYFAGPRSLAVVSEDNGSRQIKLDLPSGIDWHLGSVMIRVSEMRKATNRLFKDDNDISSEVKNSIASQMRIVDKLREKEHARIVAAIEWYEDSLTVENQTVALLEVCIGLEALLGEEDDMSEMTKRLCDRLAFTLGKTRAERTRLHDEYKELLRLRGKLVHSKIFRLRPEDGSILQRGRILLRDMIDHEIAFLP